LAANKEELHLCGILPIRNLLSLFYLFNMQKDNEFAGKNMYLCVTSTFFLLALRFYLVMHIFFLCKTLEK